MMPREADFIVVGAGAAGCLLANRLSADPRNQVVLVEAGGTAINPLIKIPLVAGLLYYLPSLNWGYQTEADAGLAGRQIPWPRGRVLGGSTAINGMMYMRGHPSDYDAWFEQGLPGWSYADVLPVFKSFERNLSHREDTEFHGREGELITERAQATNPLYGAWLQSALSAGYPKNEDFNGAHQEGVGVYDFNIDRGHRVTAYTAFLEPIRHRANLTILTRAQISRLQFEGTRCTGVDIADGRQLRARREVILCAGSIGSAQILQLSGIGDPSHLSELGLEVRRAIPAVGRNLQDHLGIYVQNACLQPVTLYSLMRPDRAAWAGLRALLFRRGAATAVPLEAGGFLKTDPALPIPDVHITVVPGLSLATTRVGQMRHGFLTNVYQLRPESRGEIRLRSSNWRDPPIIRPNYLSSETDRQCLRASVRLARQIVSQPTLDRYRGEELAPGFDVQSDADIDAWVHSTANTVFHPVGTCRMGSDAQSVVDPQLRVRGVQGLRVADASVMPTLIGGNTAVPTMMIAAKAASMILGTTQRE